MPDENGALPPEEDEPVRINRYIALCGVTSRRGADDLIEGGRVEVNGEVMTNFGYRVEDDDEVRVDGERISPFDYLYVLLNKPAGVITTTDDERDRRTVIDLVDDEEVRKAGAFPVGRLDRDTTGLLMLTNDGPLANRLMHPRYEVAKQYRVTTDRRLMGEDLRRLRDGVELEDGPAAADRVERTEDDPEYSILMEIHEGRNRQIRRMLAAIGHEVTALTRTRYAGFTLEGLPPGSWRRIDESEINRLEDQLDVR